jgi:hypothetical protein
MQDNPLELPMLLLRYKKIRMEAYLRNVELRWIDPNSVSYLHPVSMNAKTKSRIEALKHYKNEKISFEFAQDILPSNNPMIVVKRNNQLLVLSGHGRFFAMKQAEVGMVQTLFYDLDKPANYWM